MSRVNLPGSMDDTLSGAGSHNGGGLTSTRVLKMDKPRLAKDVFDDDKNQMRLVSLLYVSEAARRLLPHEIRELKRVSTRNNAALDVSGLLLYRAGRFMQLLEGPELFVATIFGRISRDPRHHYITKLSHDYIEHRTFGEWNMRTDLTYGHPAQDMKELVAELFEITKVKPRNHQEFKQRILTTFQLFEHQPLAPTPNAATVQNTQPPKDATKLRLAA